MRAPVTTCLGILMLLATAQALAAPLPPAYFTFLEPQPAPGATNVTRDTAIVLHAKP